MPVSPTAHPVCRSGGGARTRRIFGQDAELITFGIGQSDPAAAVGPSEVTYLSRTQRQEAFYLLFPGAVSRAQVKVHTVLHHLGIGDGDEQQKLALVACGDKALLVAWLVRVIRIFDEVQNL